jgi:hypothetical protein
MFRALALGVLLASLAGCAAPLTAVQQTRATEAQAFVHDAARVYQTRPMSLHVASCGVSSACTIGGRIYVSPKALQRDWFLGLIAHEVAHVVLDHRVPVTALNEMDANAKAVEILGRVRNVSEVEALALLYGYLAIAQGPQAQPVNHLDACTERRRYPDATWLTCMSR